MPGCATTRKRPSTGRCRARTEQDAGKVALWLRLEGWWRPQRDHRSLGGGSCARGQRACSRSAFPTCSHLRGVVRAAAWLLNVAMNSKDAAKHPCLLLLHGDTWPTWGSLLPLPLPASVFLCSSQSPVIARVDVVRASDAARATAHLRRLRQVQGRLLRRLRADCSRRDAPNSRQLANTGERRRCRHRCRLSPCELSLPTCHPSPFHHA